MKKLVVILLALAAVLVMATPARAASLGISPPRVELEVPADGSVTVDFQIYYFSGDIQIVVIDIPLKVTPETINVNAIGGPQDIELTIYGDQSLGSRIYTGYIRFIGMGGDAVAVGVQAKARITNLVAGQEPVLVTPTSTPAAETTAQPETSTATASTQAQASTTGTGGVTVVPPPSTTESTNENNSGVFAGLSLNMVILIAAGVVFLGLVILAISFGRRRRF